ncbi:MAG: hypothetical protein EBR74_11255, partial [Flavobacteriia bacterium]|nr:hypothetical protein [Flavobacteriia bacterium]
ELKRAGDPLYKKNQSWSFVSTAGQPDLEDILSKKMSLSLDFIRKKKGVWMAETESTSTPFSELSEEDQIAVDKQLDQMIRAKYLDINYNGINHRMMSELTENYTKNPFDNTVIIIDEVHNVKDETGRGFTPSKALDLVTKKTTVKLLLLSATPMFNDPGEIIWILNLLNRNDKRYELKESDMFKDGELRESEKHRFLNHVRGYVSYVKGENPFTFPYRIYPSYFYKHRMTPTKAFSMFGDTSMEEMKTQVYPVALSDFQKAAYEKTISVASSKSLSMGDSIPFLSVLNMTYPKGGLDYMIKKDTYEYYPGSERCFDAAHLPKYSAKIAEICKQIQKAEGIVVVYSQLLEG